MLRSVVNISRRAASAAVPPSSIIITSSSLQQQQVRLFSTSEIDLISIRNWPKALKTKQYGIDVLHDGLWNKSTGFDYAERDRLGLRGLLPPAVRSIESQSQRVMMQLRELPNAIQKNIYLQELHDRNETLYHRLLVDNMEELAPLIYTPTVGQVCMQFGHRFRRPRGMYFTRNDRGMFNSMVYNWPHDNVHVIVVTDGSRILGLGDLGAHGMGIPIGKLALYCAAGGIAPHRVLPIQLDVGTNNEALLTDPSYIGIREKRLQGKEYYDMVDEFLSAVFQRWPDVVVQFEDFETSKAVPLLEAYRNHYRIFNDDIQGTGCVTLSGIISAAKIADTPITEMRILCAGAGSAGLGVCAQLVEGMIKAGLTREQALERFVIADMHGAIGNNDSAYGSPHYKAYPLLENNKVWINKSVSDGEPLLEVIKKFKPNVLLGLTTKGGLFTEDIIRTMDSFCSKRPIIMPMSNPTSNAECTPANAYKWTNNRAIVATGSPFDPVTLPNGKKLIASQCNNMYIFPGLGLAASISGATKITDEMLYEAACAVPESMTAEEIEQGRIFPSISRIRDVSLKVAIAVIKEAYRAGLTTKVTNKHINEGIEKFVARKMYFPEYVPLIDPRKA